MTPMPLPAAQGWGVHDTGTTRHLVDFENFILSTGGQQQLQLFRALFACTGISAASIKAVRVDYTTGDFSVELDRAYRGHGKKISQEAPAGTILIAGYDPHHREAVPLSGRMTADSVVFEDGFSLFVKTDINKLAFGNRMLLKGVMLLPEWIGDKIFDSAGAIVDRSTGSIELHVKVERFNFIDNVIQQHFRIYGDSRKPGPKDYDAATVVQQWGSGQAISDDSDAYIHVLRAAYEQL